MEKLELRDYFRDYYVKNPIKPPDLLFQREIGYIPFNGSMVRHRMYNNNIEIERFVKKLCPGIFIIHRHITGIRKLQECRKRNGWVQN